LSFINQGNNLVVEVKDDGNGINLRKVKEIAIQKDLITAEQELTEKENIALIFHPGFSTKTEVSSLSGRGVGMDVVKTNVENVGGTIDVTTQQGQGSVFKIQIPLSLAVIEGLVVQNRENRYVIPLTQVQESVSLRFQKVHTDKLGIGSCLELRGTVVPLISIEEALKNGKKEFKPDGTAMIIHVDGKPLGLVVDDILRSQQIVIKPLNNGVGTQNGWIGSCVLGDGLPTLVLNPVELLKGKIANGLGEINITEVA
ncbi:MAG: chemotaxis protein CheA, partial [Pseudobdellovibrio sp.]